MLSVGVLAYAIGKMEGVSGKRGWQWFVLSLYIESWTELLIFKGSSLLKA